MPSEPISALSVGRDLAVEATAELVLGALREDGVGAILLKGPVLRRWLYDDEPVRGFVDVDVLVAPGQLPGAGETLRRLGFQREVPVDGVNREGWADTWTAEDVGVPVEVHRTLVGVRATPERLWEAVSRETSSFELGDARVEALGPSARAMHVALHAAQHGPGADKPVRDLKRALSRLRIDTWRAATILATRIEAVEAFAAGLRIVPAGQELAERLELPEKVSTETVLRLEGGPRLALGIERLASTRGPRAKAALLARKFVPEPGFMRAWSSLARRGSLGLVAAYAWRAIYLLWSSPSATWSWARARRRARHGTVRRGSARSEAR